MSLYDVYKSMQSETRKISSSYFLGCISEPIKFIDSGKFSSDKNIIKYKEELIELLKTKDFGLSPRLFNEFCQKMGEVHFYCLCLDKDIVLSKIREEKNKKTPDFSFKVGEKEYFFEVKTPSIIGGDQSINDDIEQGFDLNLYLSSEPKCPSHPRSAIVEHRPYGEMIKKYGHIRGVIKALSDKIKQNYKPEQFKEKNTFMVVNLSLIHNFITEPEMLNPVYPIRNDRNIIISGIFWMMAFRKIGMAVFGIPNQTHGDRRGIDGYCSQNGVLIDCENIEGILLITNPPRVRSEIWGLFREATLNREIDEKTLIKFTDYRHNDELNRRGVCNNQYNEGFSHNANV